MNKALIPLLALTSFLATQLRAGEPAYTPPAPAPYGLGWYWGIDAGANVYQNRGGDFTLNNQFGDTLFVSPKNDVGFFGGLKAGYVFGTGAVRPAIEADFFYNGFRGGADTTLTVNGVVTRNTSSTTFINTGAFMSNGLLRFGTGRFQPYVGAGVGIYFAESAGLDLTVPRGSFSTSGGSSHADLAWQVLVGADYYFNSKSSMFLEYRYLDYTSTQINTAQTRDLGQNLVGAGFRFHF